VPDDGAIVGDNRRWHGSLPQRITPLPDELLAGLLLRADAANGWTKGTVARLARLARSGSTLPAFSDRYLRARYFDFAPLATLLGCSVEALERTTFRGELARLGLPLWDWGSVGRPRFRVCPLCVGESSLLTRSATLPLLTCCPQHDVLFHEYCTRCKGALTCFPTRNDGIGLACGRCGMPWARLPAIAPDDATLERNNRAVEWFAYLFANGTRGLWRAIHHTSWGLIRERHGLYFYRSSIPSALVTHYDLAQEASEPSRCIALLLDANLGPEHLDDIALLGGYPLRCDNPGCRLCNVVDVGNVRSYHPTQGRRLFYCDECGMITYTFESRDPLVRRYASILRWHDIHSFYFGWRDSPRGTGTPDRVNWGNYASTTRMGGPEASAALRVQALRYCTAALRGGGAITIAGALRFLCAAHASYLRANGIGLTALVLMHALAREGRRGPVAEAAASWALLRERREQADVATLPLSAKWSPRLKYWRLWYAPIEQYPERTSDETFLDDRRWRAVADLFPVDHAGDGLSMEERRHVLGILLRIVAEPGALRTIPEHYPPFPILQATLCLWRRSGVWAAARSALTPGEG